MPYMDPMGEVNTLASDVSSMFDLYPVNDVQLQAIAPPPQPIASICPELEKKQLDLVYNPGSGSMKCILVNCVYHFLD